MALCPVQAGEAGLGDSGWDPARSHRWTLFPSWLLRGCEAVQAVPERSLSCPPDEPFSNPLAPEGHDVDDSHSFHQ